jgi:DNA-binding transcriptional LysR family regulator
MNIRHILVVNLVMELGSVSAAARRLRVSQPSITKTVRLAEEELGIPLFRRTGGRLQPTPEALLLMPEVKRLAGFVDSLRELADQIRDGRSGRIRLATSSSLANSIVPEAVALLRRQWPSVSVDLMAYATKDVIEQVTRNEVDLAIADVAVRDPGVKAVALCEADLVCVMRPDHPLAGHREVTVEDLATESVITFSDATTLGRAVRIAFHERYPRFQMASAVNQSTVACAMVEQGLGVALIDPFPVLAGAHRGLAMARFAPVVPVRPVLVHRRNLPQSQIAIAFERALRAAIADVAAGSSTVRITL